MAHNSYQGSPADIPLPPTPHQNTNTAAASYDSWYSQYNYNYSQNNVHPNSYYASFGGAAQHYSGGQTYGHTQSPRPLMSTSSSVRYNSQTQSPRPLMGEYQQTRPRQPLPTTGAGKKPSRFDTGSSSNFVPHRGSLPGSYPPHSNQIHYSQSKGQKRPQGNDDNRKSKKPRFDTIESSVEKDDSKIFVDPVLIEKRFNIWNLPQKAKVLLVSNLPMTIAKPKPLFYLFSFYGDIPRIKILPQKLNAALIEFSSATYACIARNHLDQLIVNNCKLFVSFSKHHEIKPPEDDSNTDNNLYMDFMGPAFQKLQRFNREELVSASLKRICKPSQHVHINNFPTGTTVNNIKQIIECLGIHIVEIFGARKAKEKVVEGRPSRAYIFAKFKDVSDAVMCVTLAGGLCQSLANPEGLRVTFSENSMQDEKTRVLTPVKTSGRSASKKSVFVSHDEPL